MNASQICLRSIELADAPLLLRWENDPKAWASSGSYNPLSSAFVEAYILSSNVSLVERGQMSLVIQMQDEAVGYVQVSDYNAVERRAALGVYIAELHRGRGIATEALRELIQYLRQRMRCEHLYATMLESNTISQHLFLKLGFVHTASLPHWQWTGERYEALYYYQLWSE